MSSKLKQKRSVFKEDGAGPVAKSMQGKRVRGWTCDEEKEGEGL